MKKNLTLLFAFLLVVVVLSSCSEDQKLVNIAIENSGKTYLFSMMSASIVESQVQKGQTPSLMGANPVIPLGDELFIEAGRIGDLCDLLGGNVEFFEKEEVSYDGYVATSMKSLMELNIQSDPGKELGEFTTKTIITIADTSGTKERTISYQQRPELRAIQHCEIKKLWVQITGNDSGMTKKNHAVVNLNDLISFYGDRYTWEYRKDTKLLLLKEK